MALERKDVDKKYKWDLSVIYKDEAAFYEDYAKAEKMIKAFAAHEKTMLLSAEGLYNTLKAMTDIEAVIERLWQYASLNFSVETTNNAYQALDGRVRNLAVMAGTTSWFVSPYLLRVEKETLDKWFEEYPALETYRRTVELSVRYKAHTLSDECEQLMSKMEDFLGGNQQTRSLFANADLKFGKIRNSEGKQVELTDTNYVPFLMSQDRRVRQAAFRTLYKTYEQFGNTFASLYANHIKEKTTLAKARNFKSSIESYTFSDEVTPVIYNNLISAVNGGLAPLYDY